MPRSLTEIVPAELDSETLPLRRVGALLIDSSRGLLYMVVERLIDGVPTKVAMLVRGSASSELASYIQQNNLIQSEAPDTTSDSAQSDVWYDTNLGYHYTGDDSDAFLSIKVRTTDGGTKWVKILPMTKASNIILGFDKENGGNITLDRFIRNENGKYVIEVDTLTSRYKARTREDLEKVEKDMYERLEIVDDTIIPEAKAGQLILDKTSNSLKFRYNEGGPIIEVATSLSTEDRIYLENTISIGKMPKNWTDNSIWYSQELQGTNVTDTNRIFNGLSPYYMNVIENHTRTGLKWELASTATSSRLYNFHKGVIISFNTTTPGTDKDKDIAVLTKIKGTDTSFPTDTTSYFELDIKGINPELTDQLAEYGTLIFETNQVDKMHKIELTYDKNTNNHVKHTKVITGVDEAVNDTVTKHGEWYGFNNRKVYFKVANIGARSTLEIGYVTASGMLVKIFDVNNIGGADNYISTCKFRRSVKFGNGSYVYANIGRLSISDKNKDIDNLLLLNNILPGESVFKPAAVATNAKSVFISDSKRLDSVFDGGRLISTLRPFSTTNKAIGELTADETNNSIDIYYTNTNGTDVKIVGKYDTIIADYLKNGVIYKNEKLDLAELNARIQLDNYARTIWAKDVDLKDDTVIKESLVANPTIIVPVEKSGAIKYEYRYIRPRTETDLVTHKGYLTDNAGELSSKVTVDNIDEATRKYYNVKEYLDSLYKEVAHLKEDSTIYVHWDDVELSALIKDTTPMSINSFFNTLARTMVTNGVFIGSYNPQDTGLPSELANILTENGINNGVYHITKQNRVDGEFRFLIELTQVKDIDNIPTVVNKQAVAYKHNGIYTIDKWTDIVNYVEETKDGVVTTYIKSPKFKGNLESDNAVIKEANIENATIKNGISVQNKNITDKTDVLAITTNTNRHNITIGDSIFSNIRLVSKTKPKYYSSNNAVGDEIITKSTLNAYYKWVKSLENTDIDTLRNVDHIGYYTYEYNTRNTALIGTLPDNIVELRDKDKLFGTFILQVLMTADVNTSSNTSTAGENYTVHQTLQFHDHNTDKVNTYIRSYRYYANASLSKWSTWTEFLNAEDLKDVVYNNKDSVLSNAKYTYDKSEILIENDSKVTVEGHMSISKAGVIDYISATDKKVEQGNGTSIDANNIPLVSVSKVNKLEANEEESQDTPSTNYNGWMYHNANRQGDTKTGADSYDILHIGGQPITNNTLNKPIDDIYIYTKANRIKVFKDMNVYGDDGDINENVTEVHDNFKSSTVDTLAYMSDINAVDKKLTETNTKLDDANKKHTESVNKIYETINSKATEQNTEISDRVSKVATTDNEVTGTIEFSSTGILDVKHGTLGLPTKNITENVDKFNSVISTEWFSTAMTKGTALYDASGVSTVTPFDKDVFTNTSSNIDSDTYLNSISTYKPSLQVVDNTIKLKPGKTAYEKVENGQLNTLRLSIGTPYTQGETISGIDIEFNQLGMAIRTPNLGYQNILTNLNIVSPMYDEFRLTRNISKANNNRDTFENLGYALEYDNIDKLPYSVYKEDLYGTDKNLLYGTASAKDMFEMYKYNDSMIKLPYLPQGATTDNVRVDEAQYMYSGIYKYPDLGDHTYVKHTMLGLDKLYTKYTMVNDKPSLSINIKQNSVKDNTKNTVWYDVLTTANAYNADMVDTKLDTLNRKLDNFIANVKVSGNNVIVSPERMTIHKSIDNSLKTNPVKLYISKDILYYNNRNSTPLTELDKIIHNVHLKGSYITEENVETFDIYVVMTLRKSDNGYRFRYTTVDNVPGSLFNVTATNNDNHLEISVSHNGISTGDVYGYMVVSTGGSVDITNNTQISSSDRDKVALLTNISDDLNEISTTRANKVVLNDKK